MSETESPFQVLLYYLYTPIEDPEAYRDEHRVFCEEHELLGRILIGKEGINGTVSGTVEKGPIICGRVGTIMRHIIHNWNRSTVGFKEFLPSQVDS